MKDSPRAGPGGHRRTVMINHERRSTHARERATAGREGTGAPPEWSAGTPAITPDPGTFMINHAYNPATETFNTTRVLGPTVAGAHPAPARGSLPLVVRQAGRRHGPGTGHPPRHGHRSAGGPSDPPQWGRGVNRGPVASGTCAPTDPGGLDPGG